MQKLIKRNIVSNNTLESFACSCGCNCSCNTCYCAGDYHAFSSTRESAVSNSYSSASSSGISTISMWG